MTITDTPTTYQPSENPEDFDHVDLLNDDGTVTLRMTPSAWHVHNMSPDTYQSFTGEPWEQSEIDYFNSEGLHDAFGEQYAGLDVEVNRLGTTLTYDHFVWDYNHAGIVRDLSEELANWMGETLHDAGLELVSVEVRDTWSPKEYNFVSDGIEVNLTCDPAELRALTEGFDVDEWADKHYRSRDGFMSFVTGRMNDADWHAIYHGEFRVESILAAWDVERDWVMRLAEAEYEVYSKNVTVTPDVEKIRDSIGHEESGHTLHELEAWAREHMSVYQAGMDKLPMGGAK